MRVVNVTFDFGLLVGESETYLQAQTSVNCNEVRKANILSDTINF